MNEDANTPRSSSPLRDFWGDKENKALFTIVQGKVALMLAKDSYTLTVNKAEREILKEIFKEKKK